MPLRSPNTPRKPRILLVPPPELPVPAVQGGAVETLVTHLIRENERAGKLDLLCASILTRKRRPGTRVMQTPKMLYAVAKLPAACAGITPHGVSGALLWRCRPV
ncbi:MAG: hypothetical protein ACLTZH_13840 [Subdoligranulum sp.]